MGQRQQRPLSCLPPSEAFAALACEAEALACHVTAWHTAQEVDGTDLEHCLDELTQERKHWAEAGRSLEILLLDEHRSKMVRETLATLITTTMEQRLRVSTLIVEVEREHLGAYRQAVFASHTRDDESIIS